VRDAVVPPQAVRPTAETMTIIASMGFMESTPALTAVGWVDDRPTADRNGLD
jgi:hypothetical protein